MFIGHFAVAFAARKADRKVSLGTSILAAQWLDLLWPVLLLTGTESVQLSPPGTALPLEFSHYPVSHSLLAVVGWALLFGALYYLFTKNRSGAWLVAALVMSHWILDWLVHVPDLPLTPFNDFKTGLGLWHYKIPELLLELLLFAWAVYVYMQNRLPVKRAKNIACWSLIFFLLIIQLSNTFGPPPPEVKPVAIAGLAQWLFVVWGYWADRTE